tara:strand:+ start:141 stop:335 length:195 start_codon:yes stop_codon:yes gene_type:complete
MGPVKKPAKSKTYYSGRMRERIYNEYFRVSKTAKRDCTNWKEVAERARWERLHKIMRKRYNYVG